MINLYYTPRTRSVRILWLLEELGVPYELARVTFKPTTDAFFIQDTPTGKLPTIEDGDVVMAESGAIVEYLLERYGEGRLAPVPGTSERARFLQWCHFAESTAFAPIGVVVWLTVYRDDADAHPDLVAHARQRAQSALDQVETALAGNDYLLGAVFTAADIMMGFTLYAAKTLNLLQPAHANIAAYLDRLMARPALQKAMTA
jgi:glutathione S-transferase